MRDADCVEFLKWALPGLGMCWAGFRKVHGQICKRLKRRMRELDLADFAAYRAYIGSHPDEWQIVNDCCHITISRFHRDKGLFDGLRKQILPEMALRAKRERRAARVWSAGCASGEEPYTVRILWDLDPAVRAIGAPLSIVATDVDKPVLKRARTGCYKASSLKELPRDLLPQAFHRQGELYCVREQHRRKITLRCQDLRSDAPDGQFDLVLCRNVVFTYFAPSLQQAVLFRILKHLVPGGHFVIGVRESLPAEACGLVPVPKLDGVFQRPHASLSVSEPR